MTRVAARLSVAIIAALFVIVSAPFVGEIRATIQTVLPGQYRTIIGGSVVLAVGLAIVAAVRRIQSDKLLRYGFLFAAISCGVAYAVVTRTGNPDVDVVERFHFVEYGLVTLLFYRVWKDRADLGTLVLPLVAGALAGTMDEWFQWFIPARVGELHDVMLNCAAIGCGLLFSLGLDPPESVRHALDRRARVLLAGSMAILTVTTATFVAVVHLGHEIQDRDVGTFRSRFSARELLDRARDRERRWASAPPRELQRVSREDHYLSEGLWHVQRRNEAMTADDHASAWGENLILEKFFAPVLDLRFYASPGGSRWPSAHREELASMAPVPLTYVSAANPYPIYLWNRTTFLLSAFAVAALVVAGAILR